MKSKEAAISLGIFALSSFVLLPFLMLPQVTKTNKFEEITVLQFNINYRHSDINKIIDWIDGFHSNKETHKDGESPDIILIQEVTPEILERIKVISAHYPYIISNEKQGPFGMALFSKMPIKKHERRHFKESVNEYTITSFSTPYQNIGFRLIELHAFSPARDISSKQRRSELENIAIVASSLSGENTILIGDLNTTPYSPYFQDLEKNSKLRCSMRGNGFSGTWPSFLPSVLRIPLDHVLVSDQIEVIERKVAADLDSDHLPVISRLRIYG